jgi:hypothetical protein
MPLISIEPAGWEAAVRGDAGVVRRRLTSDQWPGQAGPWFTSGSLLVLVSTGAHAVSFFIGANVPSALSACPERGYAAVLLRAGTLAHAIASAAADLGWSVSVDFSPEHQVTLAIRRLDPSASHMGTVRGWRQADHD